MAKTQPQNRGLTDIEQGSFYGQRHSASDIKRCNSPRSPAGPPTLEPDRPETRRRARHSQDLPSSTQLSPLGPGDHCLSGCWPTAVKEGCPMGIASAIHGCCPWAVNGCNRFQDRLHQSRCTRTSVWSRNILDQDDRRRFVGHSS